MSTITAGTINLNTTTGGNFGHHLFTRHVTTAHTSEYRPACAVKRSETKGEHTQVHTWEKSLDWRQYPEASSVYVPNNYVSFDYIKQYDPQQQYVSFEDETSDSDQIVTYLFDFADYHPTNTKTSLDIKLKTQINVGSSEITITSGSGSLVLNASTDTELSGTLNDWDFTSGLIPIKIHSNTHNLAISDVQIRISVTGATRSYTDWFTDNAITTTNNTVSSDARIIKDTQLEYSDTTCSFSTDNIIVGYAFANGYLDNNRSSSVVTGNAQSTQSKLASNISSYSVGTSAVFNADSDFTKIMAGYNHNTTPYFDNVAGDGTLLEDTADRGFVSGFTCSVWFHYDGSTLNNGTQHIFQFADTSATTDKVRGLEIVIAPNTQIEFRFDGVSGVSAVAPVNKLRIGWNNISFTAKPAVNFADSNLQLYPIESNQSSGGTTVAYLNGVDITDSSIGGTYPNVFNNALAASTTSPTYINSPSLLVGCQYNHGTQSIIASDSQFPIYSVYYRDRYLDLTTTSLRNALYFYGVPPATEPPEPNFPIHTITEGSSTFPTIADESGPDLFLHVDSGTIKCYTSGYARRQTTSSEWPSYVDFSSSIYPNTGEPFTWEDNPETKTVDSTSGVTIATNTAPRDDLKSTFILKNSSETLANADINAILGGSPTTRSDSDHDIYAADAETPIVNYVVGTFGGFGSGAFSIVDQQLANVHPIINTIEQPFSRIRYLIAQAKQATISTQINFGLSVDAGIIISNSHTFDNTFTQTTQPGVVIDNSHTFNNSLTVDVLGGRQYLINEQLDSAFTSTQSAQQLYGVPSIDLTVSWFNTTSGSVIIDNAESKAFSFGLTVNPGIIIDSGTYSLAGSFTQTQPGGILRAGVADIASAFTQTTNPGVVIDNSKQFDTTFTTTTAPSVLREGVSSITTNFAQTVEPQQLFMVPNIDLVHRLTKSIIVTVIPGPLPYHTVLLDTFSRTITAHESRSIAVDTSTRTAKANESRSIAVNNQNRQLKVR